MNNNNTLIIVSLVLIICLLAYYPNITNTTNIKDNFDNTPSQTASNAHKFSVYGNPNNSSEELQGNIPQITKIDYKFPEEEIINSMNDTNGNPHTNLGFSLFDNAFSTTPLAPHFPDNATSYISPNTYDNIHNITQKVEEARASIQRASNIPNTNTSYATTADANLDDNKLGNNNSNPNIELALQLNKANNIPIVGSDELIDFQNLMRSDIESGMKIGELKSQSSGNGSIPRNNQAINQRDMEGVNNIFAPNIIVHRPVYISSDVNTDTLNDIMNDNLFQSA